MVTVSKETWLLTHARLVTTSKQPVTKMKQTLTSERESPQNIKCNTFTKAVRSIPQRSASPLHVPTLNWTLVNSFTSDPLYAGIFKAPHWPTDSRNIWVHCLCVRENIIVYQSKWGMFAAWLLLVLGLLLLIETQSPLTPPTLLHLKQGRSLFPCLSLCNPRNCKL